MYAPEHAYPQQNLYQGQYLNEGQYLNDRGANPNYYAPQQSYQSNSQHFPSQSGHQYYQQSNPQYEPYHYQYQPGTREYYENQPQEYGNQHANYQSESRGDNSYYVSGMHSRQVYYYLPQQNRTSTYQMQPQSQGDPIDQGYYMSEDVHYTGNTSPQNNYDYSSNLEGGTNLVQGQSLKYETAPGHVSYLQDSSPDKLPQNDQAIQHSEQQVWPTDQVTFSGVYPRNSERYPKLPESYSTLSDRPL
jgi:hypothetical protein